MNIAAKVVTEQLDVNLRPLGLTASNYYFILKMANRGAMTQEQLFRLIHLSPSNVTRRLAQLIAAGFVTKKRAAADRRTWLLALTGKGLAIVPALNAALEATNRQVFANLSEGEQAQLAALLTQVYQ